MAHIMYLISNIQSQNTHIIAFPKFLVLKSYFKNTVEPQYSELIGNVVCSDSEMFRLSGKKKCTEANTALGLSATSNVA